MHRFLTRGVSLALATLGALLATACDSGTATRPAAVNARRVDASEFEGDASLRRLEHIVVVYLENAASTTCTASSRARTGSRRPPPRRCR